MIHEALNMMHFEIIIQQLLNHLKIKQNFFFFPIIWNLLVVENDKIILPLIKITIK